MIGQTPPPFGGQAVMLQFLLDGIYQGIDLHPVRMESSRDLGSTGKWQFVKIWRLLQVIAKIYYARLRWRPDAIYFPPCGGGLLPVARDMAVLCTTRFLFRSTIFHFHASGLTAYRRRIPAILGKVFDLAYLRPDIAIRLSQEAPSEGLNLGCRREFIIANGIEDVAGCELARNRDETRPLRVLFVALLTEEKGVLVAIETINKLLLQGKSVELTCVGGWESPSFQRRADALIDPVYRGCFDFPGVLTGEAKWERYRSADIFCFPTFFRSETFPVVLLEAMAFSLPIVSTSWRGIPDVVEDGTNAILTEPKDVDSCVRGLSTLINDPTLCASMAKASRDRFLRCFTIARHRRAMSDAFLSLKEDYNCA